MLQAPIQYGRPLLAPPIFTKRISRGLHNYVAVFDKGDLLQAKSSTLVSNISRSLFAYGFKHTLFIINFLHIRQDTYYYLGTIKRIEQLYQQTVIDTYSKVSFVKLYDRKNALVAAEMLNDKVFP